MSSTAEKRVQPHPLPFILLISYPMPIREEPLKRSQNPRHKGSDIAETAGIAVSMIPRMISIIPDAMSQPRPFTPLDIAIPRYITPDKIMTAPNVNVIVR